MVIMKINFFVYDNLPEHLHEDVIIDPASEAQLH